MFRTFDSATGHFVERDPIGLEGGLNLYAYAENDPVNRIDPLGLATFLCRKPLDALGGSQPGSGTRSGPEVPWNPLYHQFICVARPGGISCGGQTAGGSGFTHLYNEGLPSDDSFDPNRCEPVDKSDSCFENCLLATFSGERPSYGLTGPGTNCQEWSNDALAFCRRLCDSRERNQ